ncbi:peptidase M4, partial [Streptomyces sp. NPDC059766]
MSSSSSRRRTSHTSYRKTAAVALVGVSALIAAAVQSGAAAAAPDRAPSASGAVRPGAETVRLSPAQRAALIREADAAKADTARRLGLGAKEKLVVRDVLKDADGTLHTRYERTYDGLPVLGGDLVVDTTASGATAAVTKATRAAVEVASLTAAVPAAQAQRQALSLAKDAGAARATADRAPRKVVWAASGTPVLAYETVVGGLQDDGTPNQ